MYAYIEGKVTFRNPAYVVIDAGGVGYQLNISLYTYEKLNGLERARLYTHLAVREDAHVLFGFFSEAERSLFLRLTSVSGIGPNTARMLLSSLSPTEVTTAIMDGNVSLLTTVKGIGAKSAQRIVVDLRDALQKDTPEFIQDVAEGGSAKQEALSALAALGFAPGPSEKAISKALKVNQDLNVEALIKQALKSL
ncbi:MAG: Holliday junction branch migration protein RuvA [Bacteroidia bacterium]